MDAIKNLFKINVTGRLFFVVMFGLQVATVCKSDELFDSSQVELSPEVEAYFSLAIELEIKGGYRVRREIKRKVIQPLKKVAAEYVEDESYPEAENIYYRLIEITQRVYGKNNRQTEYFWSKLAWMYSKSKEFTKRVAVLEKLLETHKQRVGEYHMTIARELKKLAYAYKQMGAYSKAITAYKSVLKIYKENEYTPEDNLKKFSTVFYDLASVYVELGEYAKAEPYFRRFLPLTDKPFNRISQLSITKLNSFAYILQFTGKYNEAESLYLKMLQYVRKSYGENNMQEAAILTGLGVLYNQLGAYKKALTVKQKALSIIKSMYGPMHAVTAFATNNLAETYLAMGQYNKALALFTISSSVLDNMQENVPVELRIDKNLAVTNLGLAYLKLQKLVKAESIFRNVLADTLKKYSAYHPLIAYSKMNLAETLLEEDKYNKAAEQALDALSIAKSKRSPYLLVRSYSILAKIRWAQKRVLEAIFYGKQAVNKLQAIRGGLVSSEKSLQKAFILSQQNNYELLAGWLVDAGRLSEAEQVLTMLKENEYFNFIRRAKDQDPRVTQSNLTDIESLQQKKLESFDAIRAVINEKLKELENIREQYLTVEQKKEIVGLKKFLITTQQQFRKTLIGINLAFSKAAASNGLQALQPAGIAKSVFENTGKDIAVVYFLQLDDSLRIIVKTSKGEVVKTSVVKKAELRRSIWKMKGSLLRPDKDFKPVAKKLYHWLIEPIDSFLQKQKIKTLLMYKKGTLRYIPLAVLYDGNQFLVEKYAISQYSASSKTLKNIKQRWKVAGMGVSKQLGKFAPLPMVPFELDSIIKTDNQDPDGVFKGKIFVDAAFTQKRLKTSLKTDFNISHIATHYAFKPGTEADSYLLLGDGSRLDLASIRSEQYDFSRIELLALSACETAVNDRYADGREIEGLATLVQHQGAKGVLASLWKVADCSTGKLMQLFYHYRQQGMSKASALRQSQLDFIKGKVVAQKVSDQAKGCQPIAGLSSPGAAYKHPYYWAPFILMGNWQ